MKARLCSFLITLALLAGVHHAAAQSAQFFRVVGPTRITITGFRADGSMVWSNATPGGTYTVQTVTALPGGNNWVNYKQIVVNSSVSTNLIFASNPPAGMVLIPAGPFTMGNSIGDSDITDAIPTNVMVSAFYMDVNLVSLKQWQGVYSYATSHGYVFVHPGTDKAENTPVDTVNWYDCVKWSNARSQQAGLTPVYYTDAGFTQVFINGDSGTAVYANWGANGYRLPTEAEWEKAARGGLNGQRFPWGNTISESQANYHAATANYSYDLGPNGFNSVGNYPATYPGTSPVGSFPANGYGLYDMAGNVYEWCWDWYATPYAGGTDPRGPVVSSSLRVLRGGLWYTDAKYARCAFRYPSFPYAAYYNVGLRCAKGL